jgi:hypothetical protein
MIYVICNTDGGNVSVRMGMEETQEITFHKMQIIPRLGEMAEDTKLKKNHMAIVLGIGLGVVLLIVLSTMSSTTPSPMPKTIAIWFFFSFVSSAISPSRGFFVARVVDCILWNVISCVSSIPIRTDTFPPSVLHIT